MNARYLAGALVLTLVGCAQSLQQRPLAEYAARASMVASSRGAWLSSPSLPGLAESPELPAAPVGRLNSGTTISLTLQDTITSNRNQVGETVSALVSRDVRDGEGRVVLPAGTEAQMRITAFQRPMPHQDDARVLLQAVTASVSGQTVDLQPIGTASVRAEVQGRRMMGAAERGFAVKGGTRVEFRLPQAVVLGTS